MPLTPSTIILIYGALSYSNRANRVIMMSLCHSTLFAIAASENMR